MQQEEYQRWSIVSQRTGLSRSTVWRLEKDNKFPSRRLISDRNVAWLKSEIDEWLETRKCVTNN